MPLGWQKQGFRVMIDDSMKEGGFNPVKLKQAHAKVIIYLAWSAFERELGIKLPFSFIG